MRFTSPLVGIVLTAVVQLAAPLASAQQNPPPSGSPTPGQMQMGPGMSGMDKMKCPDPKTCTDHMKGMDHSMMGQGMGQMPPPAGGQPQTAPTEGDDAAKHNHTHPQEK